MEDRALARRGATVGLIARFCERGPSEAGKHNHSFLGKISGDDWGVVMYKHLDHHLRAIRGLKPTHRHGVVGCRTWGTRQALGEVGDPT